MMYDDVMCNISKSRLIAISRAVCYQLLTLLLSRHQFSSVPLHTKDAVNNHNSHSIRNPINQLILLSSPEQIKLKHIGNFINVRGPPTSTAAHHTSH